MRLVMTYRRSRASSHPSPHRPCPAPAARNATDANERSGGHALGLHASTGVATANDAPAGHAFGPASAGDSSGATLWPGNGWIIFTRHVQVFGLQRCTCTSGQPENKRGQANICQHIRALRHGDPLVRFLSLRTRRADREAHHVPPEPPAEHASAQSRTT